MQSYADNFTNIIKAASANAKDSMFDFPLQTIENKISEKKQRNIDISEEALCNFLWFSLKVLTPNRVYQFEPDIRGRFNPEIDHIFPLHLKNINSNYKKAVNILWNLQPTKGEINGYKTNIHPKLFFTDKKTNKKGGVIAGSKYISDYDFLFPINDHGKINFSDSVWDSPENFISGRKKLMLEFLNTKYGISANTSG